MRNLRGFSRADVIALAVMAFAFGAALLPALGMVVGIGRGRELSNRVHCSANVRGLMAAINVYANDGDMYPLLTATSATTYDATLKAEEGKGSADDTITSMYADKLQPNSPSAALWLLALKEMVAPQQFICKSDPFAKAAALTKAKESNKFYTNFQEASNLSYSSAYPWAEDKKGNVVMGGVWKNSTDSSLPIISDMAPYLSQNAAAGEQATRPAATEAAAAADNAVVMGHGNGVALDSKSNSANHQFEGEVVGFGDAHSEFVRQPDIGQNNDNIWTEKVEGTETAIDAGKLPAALKDESAPYDVVMVPTRSSKGELK